MWIRSGFPRTKSTARERFARHFVSNGSRRAAIDFRGGNWNAGHWTESISRRQMANLLRNDNRGILQCLHDAFVLFERSSLHICSITVSFMDRPVNVTQDCTLSAGNPIETRPNKGKKMKYSISHPVLTEKAPGYSQKSDSLQKACMLLGRRALTMYSKKDYQITPRCFLNARVD